ncbi:MAG: hypothetical protein ACRDGL_04500 [Candidatus Limnocylindrales bacterium]
MDVSDAGVAARLDVRRAVHGEHGILCRALAGPGWLGRALPVPGARSASPDGTGRTGGSGPHIEAGSGDGSGPTPGLVAWRIETDLALTLGPDGRVLTFRKAALVDIGPPRTRRDGCSFGIGWRAASYAPLFPVFAGDLDVTPGALRLHGLYAPPGGTIGVLIDRTFLRRFAYRTAAWFLDRLVAEVNDQAAAGVREEVSSPDRSPGQDLTSRSGARPS